MKSTRTPLLAALVGSVVACAGTPEGDERTGQLSEALHGDVTYTPPNTVTLPTSYTTIDAMGNPVQVNIPRTSPTNETCPAAHREFVEGAMKVGRIISMTDAFEDCVNDLLVNGWTTACNYPNEMSTWGPYAAQTNDPFAGEGNAQIAQRLVEDARNPNDIELLCDLEIPAASGSLLSAVPVMQDGTPNIEEMTASGFWLNSMVAVAPNVGRKEVTTAQFYESSGAGFWHEAMHQRGWQHDPGSFCNSVPYMVDQCLGVIATASAMCPDTCPGDLRPVANYNAAGCICSADPSVVHSIYMRARGRNANANELKLAMDELTAGLTFAELESSLRRPTIDWIGNLVIDGLNNEVGWQNASLRSIDTAVLNTTGDVIRAGDLSATWRAAYDATNIYFFIDVTDDVRVIDDSAINYHLDDSIEIYIDAHGDGGTDYDDNDFQIGFRPGEFLPHWGHHSAQVTPAPTLGVGFQNHAGDAGYSYEVAVPWSMLGVAPGGTLGIEVHVNDDDGAGRESHHAWATNSPDAWFNPSLFTKVAAATDVGPVFQGEPINLDGIDDEISWFRIAELIGRTPAPEPAANGTGQWRAIWSDTHLYLFVAVTDSAPIVNDGPNPWDDDSVEVYIDPDNSHGTSYEAGDFQFVFRRGDPGQVYVGGSSSSNTTGIQFVTAEVANGYTLEAAIPWGTLGVNPADETLIGFEIHINDDDNGNARDGKRSWHSTSDDSWTDPSTFGVIRTVGDPDPAGMEFYYTANPPTIDGQVNGDAGWSDWSGPPGAIDNLILSPGTVDATATWRGLWDYQNLYLHVEMDEAGVPVIDSGAAWWHDDGVELFLDPGFRHAQLYDGASEFHFLFLPNQQNTFLGSTSTQGMQGVQVSSTTDGSGFSMEIAIPWSSLGVRVAEGLAIGFDVHVNDDDVGGSLDREGKLAWALSPLSNDVSWTNARTFGRIILAP